jgi:predicted component of type VI protein secretion system
MLPQIHWKEGLFLQPHHLQRMQWTLAESAVATQRASHPYPYGVIELGAPRLTSETLAVTRLRAILGESGTEVNFGDRPVSRDNAKIPPLRIASACKKYATGFVVALALPRWSDRAPNVASSEGSREAENRCYWVKKETVCDENRGAREKELEVRLLNARLAVMEEPLSGDLETLPLFRVQLNKGATAGAQTAIPEVDPTFVAPSLVLGAAPVLVDMIQGLLNEIERQRQGTRFELAKAGRGRYFEWGQVRGPQLERLLRLRSLNRFYHAAACRLDPLVLQTTSPAYWFQLLNELLGELTVLQPLRDAVFTNHQYEHEDLFNCFSKLCHEVVDLVPGPQLPNVLHEDFEEFGSELGSDARAFKAKLSASQLQTGGAFYLAVKLQVDPVELQKCMTDGDRFKIMSRQTVWDPEYGVALRYEPDLPEGLQPERDVHYFAILPELASPGMKFDKERWGQIVQEAEIALWLGPGFDWGQVAFTVYKTPG